MITCSQYQPAITRVDVEQVELRSRGFTLSI
jgi:hypothetical protein